MQPEVKLDGFEYRKYVLCCVDDMLSIRYDQKRTVIDIKVYFTLKGYKVD